MGGVFRKISVEESRAKTGLTLIKSTPGRKIPRRGNSRTRGSQLDNGSNVFPRDNLERVFLLDELDVSPFSSPFLLLSLFFFSLQFPQFPR